MVMFILYVADQQRSKQFYQTIFNKAPILDVTGMTEFLLTENCKLGLMPEDGIAKILTDKTLHPSSGNSIPRCELYLYPQEINDTDKRLQEHAALISPLQDRNWGDRVAYYADPDGHIIAIAEKIKS